MSRIPSFLESLEQIKQLHIKKNEDYASSNNPFSNFDFTESGLALFKHDRDKAFVWPIFTKLARLGNLLSSNNPPNNESILDSFDDIAVYTLLWKSRYIERSKVSSQLKACQHKWSSHRDIEYCTVCGITKLEWLSKSEYSSLQQTDPKSKA